MKYFKILFKTFFVSIILCLFTISRISAVGFNKMPAWELNEKNSFSASAIGVSNDVSYQSENLLISEETIGDSTIIYHRKSSRPEITWIEEIKLKAGTINQPVGSGTYYVSLLGDDNNSGTSPEEAWQTIDKVNSIDFEPGDSILFEGGATYNGNLWFYYSNAGTQRCVYCVLTEPAGPPLMPEPVLVLQQPIVNILVLKISILQVMGV